MPSATNNNINNKNLWFINCIHIVLQWGQPWTYWLTHTEEAILSPLCHDWLVHGRMSLNWWWDMKAEAIGLDHKKERQACQNASGGDEPHRDPRLKTVRISFRAVLHLCPSLLMFSSPWLLELPHWVNLLTPTRIKTKREPINSLGDQGVWSWDKYDIIALPSGTKGAMTVLQWDVTERTISQGRGANFAQWTWYRNHDFQAKRELRGFLLLSCSYKTVLLDTGAFYRPF